jgi:hypothetical protein
MSTGYNTGALIEFLKSPLLGFTLFLKWIVGLAYTYAYTLIYSPILKGDYLVKANYYFKFSTSLFYSSIL